ncbi:MAG TPA: hypothetical protein VGS27_20715 [Candidatus Sulfotelmatobacter sp.]|nr:hypothetical protein [Candidatus Sulfotelmatobacter sp.]
MPRNKKATSKRKSVATKKNRTATARKPHGSNKSTSAGKSRAEGIRLFALSGRPSKEDFVKVYGPAGPKMTWEQRAKAGVPAEKFQAALASAMRQAK